MKALQGISVAAAMVGMSLLGAGCATNRGVLDVRAFAAPNPATGKSVTITRVTDVRAFKLAPRTPSVPSLKDGRIGDKAITSRAIARKRNGYGKALGDIVLPENRTVEDLIRESLTTAFRESGYRVLDAAAASDEKCIPVEADVEQFWAWMTPGVWAISLECETKVRLKGDVSSFKNGESVRGYVNLHTQGAGSRAWLNTINKGLKQFVEEVKTRLAESGR
jgi:hypothetical protein